MHEKTWVQPGFDAHVKGVLLTVGVGRQYNENEKVAIESLQTTVYKHTLPMYMMTEDE